MAQDVIDLLDHFGWNKNVHLDGVSMGGMIALELVSTWPQRFSSLVLTSTRSGRQLPPLRGITTLFRMLFIKDPAQKISQGLALVYPPQWLTAKPTQIEYEQYETNEELSLALYLARLDRTRAQTLMGSLSQMLAGLGHHVSDNRLEKIKKSNIPVLVMTGTLDHLVHPSNSHHLSQKLEAELIVFEGSGHGLQNEQTEKYNDLIDKHFTKASKKDQNLI
ncbi:hypothetical protein G6F56_012427 [Rhizopus delemar]|nr:hypothetical protein G6F56_012427 [Rhizopus delemar]